MGYIYKIQNKINGHVYIGQTVKRLEKRFQQHRNNYNKPYFSQLSLYKAFNKYGIENFTFEQVEEIPNDQLDEREKYWIEYYNSYKNGYNMTIGGRLVELYNWDINEIIQLYKTYRSARKVAEIIGCDHSTIDNLLNANNVERYTSGQQLMKIIILEKDNKKIRFESSTDAAQWLIDNKYSRTNITKNVRRLVTEAANEEKSYLGFKVYYESKIQSTPQVTED